MQQIESTPNSDDNESIQFDFKDSPDEKLRLRNPDSISSNTMNSPPYAPDSTSSLGEKTNNNNQSLRFGFKCSCDIKFTWICTIIWKKK